MSDILVAGIVSYSRTTVSHHASCSKLHKITIQSHCMNPSSGDFMFVFRLEREGQCLVFATRGLQRTYYRCFSRDWKWEIPFTVTADRSSWKQFTQVLQVIIFLRHRICVWQNCCWKIGTALLALHVCLDGPFSIPLPDEVEILIVMS